MPRWRFHGGALAFTAPTRRRLGNVRRRGTDRKSTRLNSSHLGISYAVVCVKKKFEKPFRAGPRIRASGNEATVEDVGFRSTWLRRLRNSLISIHTNSLLNATVENQTLRKML